MVMDQAGMLRLLTMHASFGSSFAQKLYRSMPASFSR